MKTVKRGSPTVKSKRGESEMRLIMKHAGGRPTKYYPDMNAVAKEYIASCGREATELPTIEGLSLLLECDDEQISIWGKKYPEFSATIKCLKSKQKNQLMNDGLYGGKDINTAMAIFLLKVNHNMIEKNATDMNLGGNVIIKMDELIGLTPITAEAATGDTAITLPEL